MSAKMNLRIINKNHAADPGRGFVTRSILNLYGHGHTDSEGDKFKEVL